MIAYPDTSFLFGIYLPQSTSHAAIAYFATMHEPLHVTELVLFEFRVAVRLQAFRHLSGSREGIAPKDASVVLQRLAKDLRDGALVTVDCDISGVIKTAERLSAEHTQARGDRAFDLMHVATAVHLDATVLLSFDVKQRALAILAGLKVAPEL